MEQSWCKYLVSPSVRFAVPSSSNKLPLERMNVSPPPMGCFLCSPSTLIPWEYKLLIWLAEVQDIPWALHHPWLRLHASTAGGTGWIPGSGQLRSCKSSGKKKAYLHEQITRLFFPTSSMWVTKWADKPEAAGSFSHTFSPTLSVPKQLSFQLGYQWFFLFIWGCVSKCLTTNFLWRLERVERTRTIWICTFANFHSVNTLTVASFKTSTRTLLRRNVTLVQLYSISTIETREP